MAVYKYLVTHPERLNNLDTCYRTVIHK